MLALFAVWQVVPLALERFCGADTTRGADLQCPTKHSPAKAVSWLALHPHPPCLPQSLQGGWWPTIHSQRAPVRRELGRADGAVSTYMVPSPCMYLSSVMLSMPRCDNTDHTHLFSLTHTTHTHMQLSIRAKAPGVDLSSASFRCVHM